MSEQRVHVYFMPGMAANISIFEKIHLPEDIFSMHYLDWVIPAKEISLEEYARQMCNKIVHDNVVLVGVSFGGILVQEMAKHIPVRKIIIISSVKNTSELPKRMVFAKYTKAHKLLPTGLVNNMELLTKYAFGESVQKHLTLYERYLSVRDKYYLDWSLDKIINWQQSEYPKNLVHIHGDKDPVFPIGYIKDCIRVENGTHAMIIYRHKWFNEHLPTIILQ